MPKRINFIKESILDIQSTIRVIDTKVGAVLLILLAPLSNVGKIADHLINFYEKTSVYISAPSILAFVLTWIIALYLSVRVIGTIDDPSERISSPLNDFSGTFYSGHLFKPKFRDKYLFKSNLLSEITFQDHFDNLPNGEIEIEKELAFEQMKLVYIRDIKLSRLNESIFMIRYWLVFGFLIYCFSKFC